MKDSSTYLHPQATQQQLGSGVCSTSGTHKAQALTPLSFFKAYFSTKSPPLMALYIRYSFRKSPQPPVLSCPGVSSKAIRFIRRYRTCSHCATRQRSTVPGTCNSQSRSPRGSENICISFSSTSVLQKHMLPFSTIKYQQRTHLNLDIHRSPTTHSRSFFSYSDIGV